MIRQKRKETEIKVEKTEEWAGSRKQFGRLTANVPRKLYKSFREKLERKGITVTDIVNDFVENYVSSDSR
jgi:hypothetical protein